MQYHSERSTTARIRKMTSAPFIFAMIVPLVVLDACLELYHQVTFRLLDIPRVPRWDYIRVDRHKLSYLTPSQRFFCAYCGYANGLLRYAARIAAESETYWCAIMHKTTPGDSFKVPEHHANFLPYGDEAAYKAARERAKNNE